MPTSIDIQLDPVTLTVNALYLILILWEATASARTLALWAAWFAPLPVLGLAGVNAT